MKYLIIILLLVIYFLTSHCSVGNENHAPIIREIQINPFVWPVVNYTHLEAIVVDDDGDSLSFFWSASGGHFPPYGDYSCNKNPTMWFLSEDDTDGEYTIKCTVSDGEATASLGITLEAFKDF